MGEFGTGKTAIMKKNPLDEVSFRKGRIIERFLAAAAGLGSQIDYSISQAADGDLVMEWEVDNDKQPELVNAFPENCMGICITSWSEDDMVDFFRHVLVNLAKEWW